MSRSGVSLNWGGLDTSLTSAVRQLADRRVLLEAAGEMLVSGTIQRFEDEEGPDGKKWAPSARAQQDGGKTLTDSARLRASIDSVITSDAVTVGSNAAYARIHQLGGKAGRGHSVTIEPRPYLGISDEDRADVQEVVVTFLSDAFRGGRA